jgi:hypothetical protein
MVEQMDVTIEIPYSFKRLEPKLYQDLVYISKSAFGFDPGLNYYIDKNRTEKFGPSNLGYIAYSSDGEPAAFYGVYSQPLIIDGKKVLAAQSGDTMTHKNHTGKGLFIRLAEMTYRLAKENSISFIFGFPNNNSYPGFVKKLSWICPYKMHNFRIKIITLPFCKTAKKIGILKPLYTTYRDFIIRIFSNQGKNFQSSVIENGVGGINRTIDFLEYKVKGGGLLREIGNCSFLFKTDGFLFLGDLERNDNINYNLVLKKIKRMCFWAGIDVIIFQTSPESFLDKKLSAFEKCSDAFYMGYLNLDNEFHPENFKYVFADIDTF